MDDSVWKDVGYVGLQLWSTLVVSLVIFGGGITANRIVKGIWPDTTDLVDGKTIVLPTTLPWLFRVWYLTRYAHPFVVGGLIGLIPGLPHPDFIASRTAYVLWFGFAGIANGQIAAIMQGVAMQAQRLVDLIVPWVQRRLGLSGRSTPPPEEEEGRRHD